MKRPHIVLVAYQCGPGMGSVSQIGWEWYSRLIQDYRVTLVTHCRNHDALLSAGAPLADSEVIEIDTEWFAGPLYRLAKRLFPRSEHSVFLVASLDYFLFDWVAYQRLRTRMRNGCTWSLLHRVTPVTLAAPTWLGRLRLPMIVGPLNSGLSDPPGFTSILRQESTWLVRLRAVGGVFDALIGSSRRAARILTATSATLRGVPEKYRARCVPMIENGVDLAQFSASPWPCAPGPANPLRVLFVGRLIPAKALPLLLEAVARLVIERYPVVLDVVGDGPLRDQMMSIANHLGLADYVRFHGALPSEAVARRMRHCHVFCLPSIRESGGAVLLEAMASARPVIAMRFGGPAELVDEEVGATLALSTPEDATTGLVAALKDVIARPDVWQARGQAGRSRVEALYSWQAKVEQAGVLYREVLAEEVAS